MKRKTEKFHWVGETLMAEEFGEVIEICNADWSGLDEFEGEHKCLMAAAHDLEVALERMLSSMVSIGVDLTVMDEARTALAKAKGKT